jgi:hypothetical protein
MHFSRIGLDETLLLQPGREGTLVVPASDFEEIKDLLEGGLALADAVIPSSGPDRPDQLTLFGDL